MVTLEINLSEDVVARLKARAEREQRTIEDLVAQGASAVATEETPEPPTTSMEALWQAGEYAAFESDFSDTSERVNEILRTEYTRYLLKHSGIEDEIPD